jgi:hypothetical protein
MRRDLGPLICGQRASLYGAARVGRARESTHQAALFLASDASMADRRSARRSEALLAAFQSSKLNASASGNHPRGCLLGPGSTRD